MKSKVWCFRIVLVFIFSLPFVVIAKGEDRKVNIGSVSSEAGALKEKIERVFGSLIESLDGSKVGTLYFHAQNYGKKTFSKQQWFARINFACMLMDNENGTPQWTVKGVGATGRRYDLIGDDIMGVNLDRKINDINNDFFIRNLWVEYNYNENIAVQVGSLESVANGFTAGYTSISTSGWARGGRYIQKKMELLGFQLERFSIAAARIDDLYSPSFTDSWGIPNYFNISMEAVPVEKLKVGFSHEVFTGIKSNDPTDHSPRIYAEYNAGDIFKDMIDSITAEARFSTLGDYPVQRLSIAINKNFKEGFAKGLVTQVAYVNSFTEDMYVPMFFLFNPNWLGRKAGQQLGLYIESPVFAQPFDVSELKFYSRNRFGFGGSLAEENMWVEAGLILTLKLPSVESKHHLLENSKEEIRLQHFKH